MFNVKKRKFAGHEYFESRILLGFGLVFFTVELPILAMFKKKKIWLQEISGYQVRDLNEQYSNC